MPDNVRDWFTTNIEIITDLSTAIFSVEIATNEVTRIATAEQSLISPNVRRAFDRLAAEARAARAVVERAVALPPIPDTDVDVEFRHAMQMQARWADSMADAATRVDADELGRAVAFQREAARQAPRITAELRKVWPTDDPTLGKA